MLHTKLSLLAVLATVTFAIPQASSVSDSTVSVTAATDPPSETLSTSGSQSADSTASTSLSADPAAPTPSNGPMSNSTGPMNGGQGVVSFWSDLDDECQSTLLNMTSKSSAFGKCSGLGELISDIVGNKNTSIVDSLQDTLKNELCDDGCSKSDLKQTQDGIKKGCPTEQVKSKKSLPGMVLTLLDNWDVAQKTLCLQDTKAKNNGTSFCVPEILNNIQTTSGVFMSPAALEQTFSANGNITNATAIPSWAYCNDCLHGIVTTSAPLYKAYDPKAASFIKNMTAEACGAKFADGKMPSTVSSGLKTNKDDGGSGSNSAAGVHLGKAASLGVFVTLTALVFA